MLPDSVVGGGSNARDESYPGIVCRLLDEAVEGADEAGRIVRVFFDSCLLYTSDAADE